MSDTKDIFLKKLPGNTLNRVTREAICTAMIRLLENKEFDRITISEIVRLAGVSRQAFYRNYTSKEDIIFEIEGSILSAFADSLDDPKYINHPRKWFYDLFKMIRDNVSEITILSKARLSDILFVRMPELVEDRAKDHSATTHYMAVGVLGGIKAICKDWFENGMKESPTQMAAICSDIVSRNLIP